MVRFIINKLLAVGNQSAAFTFQYGQIYYKIEAEQKWFRTKNLHSNMVRFIICVSEKRPESDDKFTFQYGQIYYQFMVWHNNIVDSIYIPIWLDLL